MTSPLSVALVTTFYPPSSHGGDAVHVHRLAEGLAARGHRVRVVHSDAAFAMTGGQPSAGFTPTPEVEIVTDVTSRAGTVATYLTGRPLGYRHRLARLLADVDVVHFHNPSLLGGPGAFDDTPALRVYTTHEHWLVCPMHVLFRNNRELCTRPTCWRCAIAHHRVPQFWRAGRLLPDAVAALDLRLCPSEFTAELHRAAFPGVRFDVLRLPPPAPATLAHLPPPATPDRPCFVYAGRLEPIKGVAALLDAFAPVRGAELLVAGAGSEEERLRAMAASSGAPVRFLGKLAHPEVLARCRDATAVVVPSVGYETFGGVGLEAMALGTPAVVRALGPLPELVAGGGGLTFADDRELTAQLQRLVDEPERAARLGREARTLADAVAGDHRFFAGYFAAIAESARRAGRTDLADRARAAEAAA